MDISKIEAVIFDFDGTLYRQVKFTSKFLPKLGLTGIIKAGKERKLRKAFMGKAFNSGNEFYDAYFSALAKAAGTSIAKIKKWYHEKYMTAMTKTLQQHFSARQGTMELFEKLAQKGIKTAVFSDYGAVPQRMEAIGLKNCPSVSFFNAEELGGLKPAPQPFLKIAEALNVKAENCLVAGDRDDTDGEGARRAGMNFILITAATDWEDFLKLF